MVEIPSFRELEVFRATVFSSSATATAERLGISQPSVSRILANIEQRMGMILFLRQNGRLVPTAEAFALNDELESVFEGLERVRYFASEVDALRGGRLRILSPPSFCSHFVTPMIIEFKRAHPSVMIEFRILSSNEALNKITSSEGDIAITTNRFTHPGVRMESIKTEQSVCIMPANHPLASHEVVKVQDLEGEPFIALTSNLKARSGVDQIFQRAGVSRNIIIETTTNHAACECVAAGLGVTIINPFPVISNFPGQIVVRPFEPKFEHNIFAMFPSETAPNWLGRAFLAYLKRSAANWRANP